MTFAQTVDSVVVWVAANLPIAIGGGVAIGVLTFLCITNIFGSKRKFRGLDPEKLSGSSTTLSLNTYLNEDKALNWAPPEKSYADRREAVRREGTPVRVILFSPTFRNGVSDGFVLDRSTGGMRIAMAMAMAPGTVMQVRAVNAPDTIGFVAVIIRSCRKNDDFFEIGCEFEKTPPWNVLLLFG